MLLGILLLDLALVGAAPSVQAESHDPSNSPLIYVDPVTYEITQRIEVSNQDVSALDLLELNLPIPTDWSEQKVSQIQTTGDGAFRLRAEGEPGAIVRSIYSKRGALPGPGESRSLSIAYRLERKEVRSNAAVLSTRAYEPYDEKSPDYRWYTRSEKLIETDAQEIMGRAAELRAGEENPYCFARKAYDFVVDHTEYVSPSPSHGARECLVKRQADCGSYVALFVALCRAGGVPARPVAGCWALGENQWHCWAEFLLPGVGWVPVDPSAGERGSREREYYFGKWVFNLLHLPPLVVVGGLPIRPAHYAVVRRRIDLYCLLHQAVEQLAARA